MPNESKLGRFAKKDTKKKSTRRKTTLSKGQKKETRDIAKKEVSRGKEKRYGSFFIYDNLATYIVPATNKTLIDSNGISNIPGVFNGCASMCGFQTGYYANTATTELNNTFIAGGATVPVMYPIGGYSMPNGSSSTEIDGEYAHDYQKMLNLRITMEVLTNNNEQIDCATPTSFRVLVVRAGTKQAGLTPSLVNSLFVDDINERAGIGGTACSAKQIMSDWDINKNQFHKVKEYKFTLQNPSDPNTGGTNTLIPAPGHLKAYPTERDLKIKLPVPKKKLRFAELDDGVSNNKEPVNYDFVTYVLIMASHDNIANPTRTSRYWSVRASGKSVFKDM